MMCDISFWIQMQLKQWVAAWEFPICTQQQEWSSERPRGVELSANKIPGVIRPAVLVAEKTQAACSGSASHPGATLAAHSNILCDASLSDQTHSPCIHAFTRVSCLLLNQCEDRKAKLHVSFSFWGKPQHRRSLFWAICGRFIFALFWYSACRKQPHYVRPPQWRAVGISL